jgi:hypothetical protein
MTGKSSYDQFIKSATAWTVLAEGKRHPSTMVTHAMALDLVQSGQVEWDQAIKLMPMSKQGKRVRDPKTKKWVTLDESPVAEADRLKAHLFGKRGLKSPKSLKMADDLADREVELIKLWVSKLDLDLDSESTAEQHKQKLFDAIEARMTEIYRKAAQT